MSEDWSEEETQGGKAELKTLADQCDEVFKLENEIEELQQLLKDKGEELRELRDIKIPTYMTDELGWSKATLADGREVTVKPVVRGHISKEKKPHALRWLREHEAGSIIKNEVKVKFPAGEEQYATALVAELEGDDYNVEQTESVHPQTLAKFIRECLAEGKELDRELLGVYTGSTVKIK